MSELRRMTGLMFKNDQRVVPEDCDYWGVVRLEDGREYKLRHFRQKVPGRWSTKLEPVLVKSGQPAKAVEKSG